MAAVVSHQDTEAQRGTKADAVTEVFVFLGVLVALAHFPRFIPFPFTTTPEFYYLNKNFKKSKRGITYFGPGNCLGGS